MKTDVAQLLGMLAAAANGEDETHLRDGAGQAGIRLRRVRLRGNDWWRKDLGILISRDAAGKSYCVIEALGGGAHVVDADGRRTPLTEVAASGLCRDALAVAGPEGRMGSNWPTRVAAALLAASSALLPLLLGRDLEPPYLLAALVCASAALLIATFSLTLFEQRRRTLGDLARHVTVWNGLVTSFDTTIPPETLHARVSAYLMLSRQSDRRQTLRLATMAMAVCNALVLVRLAPGSAVVAILLALLGAAVAYGLERRSLKLRQDEQQQAARTGAKLSFTANAFSTMRQLGEAGFALERPQAALKRRRALAGRIRTHSDLAVFLTWVVLGAVAFAATVTADRIGQDMAAVLLASLQMAGSLLVAARNIDPAFNLGQASWLPPPPRNDSELAHISCDRIVSLDIKGVHYGYPGAAPLLQDVNLTIRAGEVVAITGPSGSGKSTLIRIALGLVPPDKGTISINGQPLTPTTPAVWRKRVAAVFQDEALPLDTIRSVVMGLAPVSMDAVWDALALVDLDRDIKRLPMGIQTLVAAGTLPSGMIQRLLIARAIIRDPDIVFLDEATTGLDEDQQSSLVRALRTRGKGVLIASHRETAHSLADRTVALRPLSESSVL